MVRAPAVALALLAGATLAAGDAAAYPFLALRPGGTPFEGPADPEISSLWWNPAALGLMHGLHAELDGQLLVEHGAVARSPICLDTGLPGAACGPLGSRAFPSARLLDLSFTGLGGIAWDFRQDNVMIAFGVYAPWESHRSFSDGGPGGAGTPTAYHLRDESFTTVYYALAVAFRIVQRLHVGVNVAFADTWADLLFDRDAALDGGGATVSRSGYENPASSQGLALHGTGGSTLHIPSPSGLSTTFGVVYSPTDRLTLGFAWMRMFPIFNRSSGYSVSDAVGARLTGYGASACPGGVCQGGDEIDVDVPDVWQLGARIALRDDLELSTWARVVVYGGYGPGPQHDLIVRLSGAPVTVAGGPSQIVLARSLVPAFAGEVGVRWRVRPWLRLGLSAIAETGALPPAYVNAEAIDGPKLDGMLAAEFRLRWFRLTFGYELTALFLPDSPTAFDPGETVRCVDSRFALATCAGSLAGRGLPTSAGTYSLYRHHFSLALGFDF